MSDISPTPGLLWRTFVITGVGTMTAVTVDDRAWEAFSDATGGAVKRDAISRLLIGTAVLHTVEGILAYRSAKKAHLRRPTWWGLSTLIWGFPVIARLRKAKRAT
jgi:hypothetical protein